MFYAIMCDRMRQRLYSRPLRLKSLEFCKGFQDFFSMFFCWSVCFFLTCPRNCYNMRKVLILLSCLTMALNIAAQDITGVWAQRNSASENGVEMTVSDTLKIAKDGSFYNAAIMEMSMDDGSGQKATIKMLISCSGTWDYEAGVLTQTYDAKSIRSEMIEQPEGFPKMFANMIAKKSVSELKKHAKRPQRSTVLTLTSDTLKLKDTMEKNPETDSYMRVKTEL